MDFSDIINDNHDIQLTTSHALIDDELELTSDLESRPDSPPKLSSSSKKSAKKPARGGSGRGRGGKRTAGDISQRQSKKEPKDARDRILTLAEQSEPDYKKKIKEESVSSAVFNDTHSSLADDAEYVQPEEITTPLIEEIKYESSDWESFNQIKPNKMVSIQFNTYKKMVDDELNYYINYDSDNDSYSISSNPSKKSIRVKNIGHYLIILNYERWVNNSEQINDPIIIGLNQQTLNVEYSRETLQIFEYVNKNRNVKMYVFTTKKEYAEILLRKFSESDKRLYEGLKQDKWINLRAPNKISKQQSSFPSSSYAASSLEV